ncbi:hypothetical protein [Rhodoferax sp.]|uniref:hypothetical protein n=1 Tax=Rhodoferax sp. TaxID=50421 RepID=UPI002735B73F|nr:hypothetical protein [Rhodoferax sp.]MDP3190956.1 hypothetical protein [Rhodoferax sp.]MDP3336024.1 hypothetical protein [Rhodoferax sp.]
MIKRLLLGAALVCAAQLSLALSPYTHASKLPAAELPAQLSQVEKKLQAEGFSVLGQHLPKGVAGRASLVVADPAMLAAIRASGPSSSIVAAAIRVGVDSEGNVSYMNPDYWYRAYLRGKFAVSQEAVKSVQQRLVKALGEGTGFGGDVPQAELTDYRYMFGMERFDSANSELASYASFDEALKAVKDNLAKGVGDTRQVYEVVMPDKKMAVFGVAMNSSSDGEGWWVNKIGTDHPAALPYELFIVDNKVYALYARYRIALAWPALGMGQFMTIINAPEAIRTTMVRLATAGK